MLILLLVTPPTPPPPPPPKKKKKSFSLIHVQPFSAANAQFYISDISFTKIFHLLRIRFRVSGHPRLDSKVLHCVTLLATETVLDAHYAFALHALIQRLMSLKRLPLGRFPIAHNTVAHFAPGFVGINLMKWRVVSPPSYAHCAAVSEHWAPQQPEHGRVTCGNLDGCAS